MVVTPPTGGGSGAGFTPLGGIGGTAGCFSPGRSQILPLCRVRSCWRISSYFDVLTASVLG